MLEVLKWYNKCILCFDEQYKNIPYEGLLNSRCYCDEDIISKKKLEEKLAKGLLDIWNQNRFNIVWDFLVALIAHEEFDFSSIHQIIKRYDTESKISISKAFQYIYDIWIEYDCKGNVCNKCTFTISLPYSLFR